MLTDAAGNTPAFGSTADLIVDTAAPTAALAGQPSGTTLATALAITVSGTDVVSYKYKVGVTAATTCSDQSNYGAKADVASLITDDISSLADGAITLCTIGSDLAGNWQALAAATSISWTKDTSAPTATYTGEPASTSAAAALAVTVSGTDVTHYQAKAGVAASTDCTAASGYSGETAVATAITTIVSALADGALKLCIIGRDITGNWQTHASATSYTWTKDRTGPVTTLTPSVLGTASTAGATTVITGASADGVSTATGVQVSIQEGSGSCLNTGLTAFNAACPNYLTTTFGSGTWSLTVNDSVFSEATYNVSMKGTDSLSNIESPVSTDSFVWDVTSATFTSLSVAAGVASTSVRDVSITAAATDAGSGIAAVRFAERLTTCQAAYADNNWQTWTGSPSSYNFTLSFLSEVKMLCGWLKDNVGNISTISAAGVGTDGTDRDAIDLQLAAPPAFTALTMLDGSSQPTGASGTAMTLSWTVTSGVGLKASPIIKVEYTTDVITWTQLPSSGVPASTYGSTTSGATSWSSTYALSSPSSSTYAVRVLVQDLNGSITSATTNMINGNGWTTYAGTWGDDEGSTTNAAMLVKGGGTGLSYVVKSKLTGDLYTYDVLRAALYKIGMQDGLVTKIATLTGTYNRYLAEDVQGKIYYADNGSMYRFDPSAATITPALYFGGGTQLTTGIAANDLKILPDSPFAFDAASNLYLITCATDNAAVGKYIFKVAQNADGTAGTATLIAGTGAVGTPTFGNAANTQPLPAVSGIFYHSIAVNADGSAIYFSSHIYQYKIISGIIRSTALTLAVATPPSFNYNPYDSAGKPFYRMHNGTISRFAAATAGNGGETLETVVGGSSTNDCNDEGKDADTAACAVGEGGMSFGYGDKIIWADGVRTNINNRQIRMRTIVAGNVRTIAGTKGLLGEGGDKLLAKFNRLSSIAKDSTGAIYFVNDSGPHLVKVASGGSSNIAMVMGNNNPHAVPTTGSAAANQSMGWGYSYGNLTMGIDPNDQIYMRLNSLLYYIDTNGNLQGFGGVATTRWSALNDGDAFNFANSAMSVGLGVSNMDFDDDGNIYLYNGYNGAINYTGPRIVKLDAAAKTLHWMAGNYTGASGATSNTFTADGATAKTATIRCDTTGTWSSGQLCAATTVLHDDGKLYFSEVSRLRFLSTLDGTALLDTLADGDGTDITDLVTPYQFKFVGNRIYYISTGNKLYCRWKGTVATQPADCQNALVNLPLDAYANQLRRGMVVDANGDLLIVSHRYAASAVVLKYDVP